MTDYTKLAYLKGALVIFAILALAWILPGCDRSRDAWQGVKEQVRGLAE